MCIRVDGLFSSLPDVDAVETNIAQQVIVQCANVTRRNAAPAMSCAYGQHDRKQPLQQSGLTVVVYIRTHSLYS